jgi:sporulation protein YlmC with PRC-barrel domain
MRTTLAAAAALILAAGPVAAQTGSPSPMSFVDRQNNSEVLGTDFIGTPVVSKDGQPLGKISNLVFGPEGRIELAVVGVGGFLGIGEKEVAVPFESIRSDSLNNRHVFILDATKDDLKAAPTYRTLNDQAFNERMRDWRTKAQQSWTDIKSRASKAYDEAKQRVEQPSKPE